MIGYYTLTKVVGSFCFVFSSGACTVGFGGTTSMINMILKKTEHSSIRIPPKTSGRLKGSLCCTEEDRRCSLYSTQQMG